jgi:hypothetical protein
MKTRTVIYSGNQASWLTAVAGAIMDGGDKPPSVARLLRIIPRKVGATATNDAHVTAAENGYDRKDIKAGQQIWIEGAIEALRKAKLVDGDDDALIWLGNDNTNYKVKFGTRGKERIYTIHSASARQANRDAYLLGTPEKDPWENAGIGAEGRVMRGDTSPLEVKVRTRSRGKEFIKERKLEMHPLALAIPPMTVEEQQGIRANIEKYGVKMPVVLFPDKEDLTTQGNPKLKVLDGRHRTYFASVTDQPIEVTEFEGTEEDARDLVASLNLHRRNLTGIQRALAAERLFGEQAREEARKDKRRKSNSVPTNLSEQNGRKRGPEAHQRVRIKAGGNAAGFSDADAKAAATINKAPKTAAKVDSGLIRRASVAKREAQAEIEGRDPAKPEAGSAVSKPKSVNEHVGSALSSLRTAAGTLNLPLGKTTPRDMERRLDEIITLANRIKKDYAR